MITCYTRYEIEPSKVAEFKRYARFWLELIPKFGGTHHGYFLPHESANDIAVELFSFESLAAYERYRAESLQDPDCQEAYAYAEETDCIRRYERQFLSPLGA